MTGETAGNTARAALCVLLLVVSLAAGTQGSRVDVAVEVEGAARGSVTLVSRLDASVHPAADPLFGALWSVSHRLIVPVQGVNTADLVDTFAEPRATGRLHEAIDIPAPRNTPVVAVTDGIVLRLAEHDSGGTTLYQVAPDGRTVFYYAHLMSYADGVRAGMPVRQGDVIGYVGDTGNAGPGRYHLHFEVMTISDPGRYWVARPRNPYPLLKRARG